MEGNFLLNKQQFEDLLQDYKPNQGLINLLPKIKMVLLVAPVAAGRNTIIKELVKNGKYYYLISDTTRAPRTNDGKSEINGEEYWFKQETEALDDIKKGNYLGPAIIHNQQMSGIHIDELKRVYDSHQIAITDMDIQGSKDISKYKRDAKSIFILPPEFDKWMERLDGRGEMTEKEKRRRLLSASIEISAAIEDQSLEMFINHELHLSAQELDDYINNGKRSDDAKQNVLIHANELLARLEMVLS